MSRIDGQSQIQQNYEMQPAKNPTGVDQTSGRSVTQQQPMTTKQFAKQFFKLLFSFQYTKLHNLCKTYHTQKKPKTNTQIQEAPQLPPKPKPATQQAAPNITQSQNTQPATVIQQQPKPISESQKDIKPQPSITKPKEQTKPSTSDQTASKPVESKDQQEVPQQKEVNNTNNTPIAQQAAQSEEKQIIQQQAEEKPEATENTKQTEQKQSIDNPKPQLQNTKKPAEGQAETKPTSTAQPQQVAQNSSEQTAVNASQSQEQLKPEGSTPPPPPPPTLNIPKPPQTKESKEAEAKPKDNSAVSHTFLDDINKGEIHLKKTEPQTKTQGGLLADIRGGVKLKPAKNRKLNEPIKNNPQDLTSMLRNAVAQSNATEDTIINAVKDLSETPNQEEIDNILKMIGDFDGESRTVNDIEKALRDKEIQIAKNFAKNLDDWDNDDEVLQQTPLQTQTNNATPTAAAPIESKPMSTEAKPVETPTNIPKPVAPQITNSKPAIAQSSVPPPPPPPLRMPGVGIPPPPPNAPALNVPQPTAQPVAKPDMGNILAEIQAKGAQRMENPVPIQPETKPIDLNSYVNINPTNIKQWKGKSWDEKLSYVFEQFISQLQKGKTTKDAIGMHIVPDTINWLNEFIEDNELDIDTSSLSKDDIQTLKDKLKEVIDERDAGDDDDDDEW